MQSQSLQDLTAMIEQDDADAFVLLDARVFNFLNGNGTLGADTSFAEADEIKQAAGKPFWWRLYLSGIYVTKAELLALGAQSEEKK
jgi:hypothetical protein